MFKLEQAGERTYYLESHNIVGIYLLEKNKVCLIDTGNGTEAAQEIHKVITDHGWELSFIINTHTHIDHLGGNRYLMEKWNCPAYATRFDNVFANYEDLEASYMYGGQSSRQLNMLFRHPGPIGFKDIEDFVLPEGLEYVHLPGHTFGMIGVKTSDQVWFLGDSILNRESLEKYQFGYLTDVQGYLDTLDLLETLEGKLFIPAHGDVVRDIRPLINGNRENMKQIMQELLLDCKDGKNFDLILKNVFDRYKVRGNVIQHAVIGSSLRCYLTHLQDRGKLKCYFEDNIMKWKTL